jgi:RecA-family ATPase
MVESKIRTIDALIAEAENYPELNFIWKGIKEHTLNIIAAPPKIGKTTLCENLGMSIAAGNDNYLGDALWYGDNQTVLMISLEEFWISRTARNKSQIAVLDRCKGNINWHQNYKVVNAEGPRYFQSKADWKWLISEIELINPRMVIIDSLSRLHLDRSIEDSTVCLELTKNLRKVVDKTGTTLIVIHHMHKLKPEPISLSNMAGSRILAQEADAIIGMNKTPLGKRYIKPLAYRYADDNFETVQLFDIDKNGWLIAREEVNESRIIREFDNRTNDSNKEKVLNCILEYTGGDNSIIIESSTLISSLVEPKIISKPTMYSILEKLEEEGSIQKQAQGEYTLKQE